MKQSKIITIVDAFHNGCRWEGTDNDWHVGEDEYLWPKDRTAIASRIVEADACLVETEDGSEYIVRADINS